MDTKILPREDGLQTEPYQLTGETIHRRGTTETTSPKRPGPTRPTTLKWFACQAVKLSPDGKYVELRSFPFFALSLEHARRELLEATKKDGCPFNRIYQYGHLNQTAGRLSTYKKENTWIDVQTGRKA